jgi:hypothetical protein
MMVMAGKPIRFDLQIDDNATGPATNILVWHRNDGMQGDCSGNPQANCCALLDTLSDEAACDNTQFGWVLPVMP